LYDGGTPPRRKQMELFVRGHGVEVNTALSGFCRGIVTGGLSRLRGGVRRVLVLLEDVNGPRGGVDKRCRMVLALADGRSLVVDSAAGDVYAAVVEATHRAKQNIARRLSRLRTCQRRSRGHARG
jgi:putative sigma-54 modulation protein